MSLLAGPAAAEGSGPGKSTTRVHHVMTQFYWLTLAVLCVWRITHLLQAEDGPFDLVAGLRRRAGDGFWGSLLDCFYCLSLWISAPFALVIGGQWGERLMLWLALSAGAILLERITNHKGVAAPATFFEDKEGDDVLLWQTETTVPGDRSNSTDQRVSGEHDRET